MGSRAVVIVCRDEAAARQRSASTGEARASATRAPAAASSTTRALEAELLDRVRAALDPAGLLGRARDRLGLPRLRADAVVGEGAGAAARAVRRGRRGGARRRSRRRSARSSGRGTRGVDVGGAARPLPRARTTTSRRYVDAYRRYCWPVDVASTTCELAPFHLLASEGAVHVDQDHVWHMETLARALRGGRRSCSVATASTARATSTDPASEAAGDGLVGGADRARRRGHGGQAAATSSRAASAGSCSRR